MLRTNTESERESAADINLTLSDSLAGSGHASIHQKNIAQILRPLKLRFITLNQSLNTFYKDEWLR